MRKGISPLIGGVMLIAVALLVVSTAVTQVQPLVSGMEDVRSIDGASSTLTSLSSTVRQISRLEKGSHTNLSLSMRKGSLYLDPAHDLLYYRLETGADVVDRASSRSYGRLSFTADADVTVSNGTVNGVDCTMLENSHLEACIRKVGSPSSPAAINTSRLLVRLYNKDLDMRLNATLRVYADANVSTAAGTGHTSVDRYGTFLERGSVTAHVDHGTGSYNTTIILPAQADFLVVRTDD